MNNTFKQALSDTLEYLISLSQEGIRLDEAKKRLNLLQKRYPDTEMNLLWEEETYDQSIHYDTLLNFKGKGTVSLSFCRDNALPWPMRGVHRWSEKDLVRVNNTVLSMNEAIACLDFIWDEVPIIKHLVDMCLIREVLEKDPIELSDADLQVAMNAFRKARKLYKADETYHWLEKHGITHEKLENLVANEAIVSKLRDRVTLGKVEEYFAAHRIDFDTAQIAQIYFPDKEIAYQEWKRICSGEVSFYESAQCRFLEAAQFKHNLPGDIFAVVQRGQATMELGMNIFASECGEVLEPIQTEKGYAIVLILSFKPAHLDERTVTTIKKILFEEWLADRQQIARIEWYWGNIDRTAQ
jgi:putative peptide maturation system protein